MLIRHLRTIALCIVVALLLLACDLSAVVGGSAKPTVIIQSPANGSQFREGEDVAIQSVANDPSGIARVDLTVDGVTSRTDKPSAGQTGSLALVAQKWQATAGAHTIGVRAYNTSGIPSDPVTIAVIVSPSAAQAPSPFPGLATTAPSPAAVLSPPTLTSTVTAMATVSPTATVTPTVSAMATVSPTATVGPPPPIVLPPCPPASAMPSGVLFCDDFASQAISESKGWNFHTDPDVDFTWSPNIATMAVKKQDWFGGKSPDGEYDDFGAEIEAQPLSDGYAEYGLIFRMSGEGDNNYELGITTDGGYYMYKRIAGKYSDVDPVKLTPAPSVRPGKNKNRIGVIAQGNTFALYINRVLVNTITDDSLLGKGKVGVLAATGVNNANAVVAFSLLAILTPDQARAEWSNAAPAPSSSSQPTTAPVQPSAPPGLYVTNLRTDPPALGERMDAGFYVTFLNTTNADQQYRWNVYVFRADNPKNSFSEASPQLTTIPVGTVEQKALGSWRLGVGTCGDYFARVAWLDEAKNRTFFAKPDGGTFEYYFTVCPSTQAPPTPTMSSVALPPPVPPTPVPATATPALSPGIYVDAVALDPAEPKNGQYPAFQVTFINTLGQTVYYKWFVKIYDPDAKQSMGETAKVDSTLPAGTSVQTSAANWKAIGTSPCRQFIARVFYQAPDKTILEFPKPGGDTLWRYFAVCQ